MKKFLPYDARNKIRGNVKDARQTLKNRSFGLQSNSASTRDARYKIRAKKFQPIKQELLKIKSSTTENKVALPGRTIRNKEAAVSKEREQFKPVSRKDLPGPSGFISVSNGKRTLVEKVTVHQTGLKISLQNDLASSKISKQEPGPSRKSDHSLKITLNNPDAIPKSSSSSSALPSRASYHQKAKPLRESRESLSLERSRRRHDDHSFQTVRKELPHAALMSNEPKFDSYANPIQHIPSHLMSSLPSVHPMSVNHPTPFSPATSFNIPKEHAEAMETFSAHSPLEGTKILVSNLHPIVVEDDILELFSVVGPVRRARLIGLGKAEVVFVRKDDAVKAYQKYNKRELDGQPMFMKLMLQDQPMQSKINYSWMSEIGQRKTGNTVEIEPGLLQRSLFKTASSAGASKPVVFTVKI